MKIYKIINWSLFMKYSEMRRLEKRIKQDEKFRINRKPGYYSNLIIRERNGGVKHLFEDSIGGCSSNYK
jgi:hypothetical protein